MVSDVRRRAPYYITDWTLAFQPNNIYRVSAAAVRMYFVNLMPALAYTVDMNLRTGGNYGVNETLLASALAALVFPVLGVQPLTIVGVTGLINLFNYTNYTIVTVKHNVNYLQFQAWVYIWAAIMHWGLAIFNVCDYVRFITDMTAECFGFYVGVIYIEKGIELLVHEFDASGKASGWLACLVALCLSFSMFYIERAGKGKWGPAWIRRLVCDYTFILTIVFWAGFTHIPGNIKSSDLEYLTITKAFAPSTDRNWVIDFWNLEVKWIFIAIPFGVLMTMLFWLDHNVSALMASARKFPVNRPSGANWDFFLLGCTTFVAGIIGLPAPNGLVPQAPEHTAALSVEKQVDKDDGGGDGVQVMKKTRVIEQRVSHLAIGLLTLGTMTRPLLVALHTIPLAIFAGVFIIVGWNSVVDNAIVHNTLYLFRHPKMVENDHPLKSIRRSKIALFISIQWFVFGIAVAISQIIAGIGFPVPYLLLIPARQWFGPRWFTDYELSVLDAPVANSEAVIASIGGDLHLLTGERPALEEEEKTTNRHDSSEKGLHKRKGTKIDKNKSAKQQI